MDKAEVKSLVVGDVVLVKTSIWEDIVPPNQTMRNAVVEASITKVRVWGGTVFGFDLKCDEYEKEFALPIDFFREHVDIYKTGLKTKDKLRGHAFKGTVLKNTTGTKNQDLIDKFQGEEFLLDSFSSKYVYGFPVGHFGDLEFRFQLELSSVLFYTTGQDFVDNKPCVPLHQYICMVVDNW